MIYKNVEESLPETPRHTLEDLFSGHLSIIVRFCQNREQDLNAYRKGKKHAPTNRVFARIGVENKAVTVENLSEEYQQRGPYALIRLYRATNENTEPQFMAAYLIGKRDRGMYFVEERYLAAQDFNTASDTSYKHWLYQQAQRQIRQDQSMQHSNEVDPWSLHL